jgi:hypothetical protein
MLYKKMESVRQKLVQRLMAGASAGGGCSLRLCVLSI